MSATLEKVIPFALPKKPKVKQSLESLPDRRNLAVVPIRACGDDKLGDATFRVLATLASYCNRAGLTWVSQTKLASDMGVTQQAISKHFKKLLELGYIEVVRKGFKGERTDTLRVIFDPSITAEEAIAITSTKEDTRPPAIKAEQEKQMYQEVDKDGLKRIAQLVAGISKQPAKPKGQTMTKAGESPAVKRMKEDIAKAKNKRSKAVDKSVSEAPAITTPEVVIEKGSYHNQITTSEVVVNVSNTCIKDTYKVNTRLNTSSVQLQVVGLNEEDCQRVCAIMSHDQAVEAADLLTAAFKAEGITPSSRVLADSILQLHRDTSRIAGNP